MNGRLFLVTGAAVLMIGCAHSQAGVPVPRTAPQTTSQVSIEQKLIADFTERVTDYMKLHEKLRRKASGQNPGNDVAEIRLAQQALAMRIRSERRGARPGNIFRPAIALALRRALNPELRGPEALETREAIRDDGPATFVLAVNAEYPPGRPLSTMPPNVLAILPPLPKGLEYRIVGTHLLLLDVEANLIVDYILDVMCKAC